jgi:anaerobic dimethyl sulfoxide reductase subunit B (iron-sulfur subunit)
LRRAFTFDASTCTGCKACQVACKDKNGLPDGVLWRRVYEVSGGGWERSGAAWKNSVFSYSVSVSCNHCANPACAAACPTNAYAIRGDGIVWVDSAKCVGCRYCAWACPYGAPQYSDDVGYTTKCDGCRDLLDDGLPPACVAACPLRALNYVATDVSQEDHPYPLPPMSWTRPQLAIAPHPAMFNPLAKVVANREEVRPAENRASRRATSRARVETKALAGEWPLVGFTLLAQAAAGLAILSAFAEPASRATLPTIAVLIGGAALLSVFHLGRVHNVWRSPANIRHSPLSREVLALLLFGAVLGLASITSTPGRVALAASGATLVVAMGAVYHIKAVPGWGGWRTHAAFAWSALLLGGALLGGIRWSTQPRRFWLIVSVAVLAFGYQVWVRGRFYERLRDRRM